MNEFRLRLLPDNQSEAVIELHQNTGTNLNVSDKAAVYADSIYGMKLESEGPIEIAQILVYVNGNREECILQNDTLLFLNQDYRRKLFSDYFGFVKIEIDVDLASGEKLNLRTDNLSVLVKKNVLSNSVDEMLEYIFKHEKGLLYKDERISVGHDDLKKTNQDNISSKLKLAEEIAIFYEDNFGYFSANSRFKVMETYEVDHVEKMQHVSPRTLQYMATHPDSLKQTAGARGLRWNGKNYYPEKTLIGKSYYSTDTDENQVIVGFLSRIIYDLETISEQMKAVISKIPTFQIPNNQYIHSASLIFDRTESDLENKLGILQKLISKFKTLRNLYKETLRVTLIEVSRPPKPTPTFMAIPHYNMIFNSIYQWFDFGIYDFQQQNFMLSAVNISSLYEIYTLCRLLEDAKSKGYVLIHSYEKRYITPEYSKFQNANCKNTFVFQKANTVLTLYYQPVIYNDYRSNQNGIGLYRNNSYSLGTNGERGTIYSPDFIIKIEADGKEKYSILDAKFSNRDTVERYKVAELCYKYLISISTINPNASIDGMYILYGKCTNNEKVTSIYDFELVSNPIVPKALIVPVSEKQNHIRLIGDIIM